MEKELRLYDIHYVGLTTGEHVFNYEITDSFFKLIEESPLQKGDCNVKLVFEKEATHFVLSFSVEGNVEVECDRCTADIKYPIYNNFKLYIKFDDQRDTGTSEDDDEMIYIPRSDSTINVAQFIYEYISLSIPMVRNCDFLEEKYKNCNQEILKKLKNESTEHETDARWEKLKNIKLK
ncbi:MAG: hypothetical protein RL708_438 [Bacteroidota bacterium]